MLTRLVAYFFIVGLLLSYPIDTRGEVPKDSLHIRSLINKATANLYRNIDSASFFTDQLLSKENLKKGVWVKAQATFLSGHILLIKGDYQQALLKFHESLKLSGRNRNDPLLFNNYLQIGAVYHETDSLQKALSWYIKALQFLENVQDDPEQRISLLNKMGILHCKMADHRQELQYFRNALHISTELDKNVAMAQSYQNVGVAHFHADKPDSASYYFEKSARLYHALGLRYKLALISNNLGATYVHQKKYDAALKAYQEAITIYKEFGNLGSQGNTLHNIAEVYQLMGQHDKALNYLFESVKIADSTQNNRLRYTNYEAIAKIYYKKENYKAAYDYHTRFAALRDSVMNEEVARQVNELKTSYQAEALTQKNQLLEQEKILHQAEISQKTQQRNGVLLTLALVVLSTALLILYLWHRNRIQKARLAHTQAERNRQITELLKKQEISFLDATVQGQQLERQRIASDLHDRLGSLLATVKLYFSDLQSSADAALTEKKARQLTTAGELLDQACQEVRLVAHNLSGTPVHQFQLVEALQHLRDVINQSGQLHFQLFIHGISRRLPPHIEVDTFRIIQEVISNVLRHARAKTVTVQLSLHDEKHLNVVVEDNGAGFDTQAKAAGMGLNNIRARVERLNGDWFIDSHPERGTSIILDIPVQEDDLLIKPAASPEMAISRI